MQVYLPIAELSVNLFLLLGIGGGVGFMSGLFGVGGGFLTTPMLIFIGVPPAVAVATQANQVVASSVSGVLAHWSRNNVDFKMGFVLLAGGILGSTVGVGLFSLLSHFGQVDLVIRLFYVFFLGFIGILMFVESARSIWHRRRRIAAPRKLHEHTWVHGLPLKMRFRRSRLYISALLPGAIGFFVGILSAIMGVGGAFIMVPAMIYLLGMPTTVVIGTSNFQILFVAANVTFLQAATNGTVDIVLALLLIVGGVVGAPIGSRIAARLPGVVLRGLMAVLVLAVAAELLTELLRTPSSQYSISGRETPL